MKACENVMSFDLNQKACVPEASSYNLQPVSHVAFSCVLVVAFSELSDKCAVA